MRAAAAIKRCRVLFLCTGNSCRSQMAEGWARRLHADSIEAHSAGVEKHGLNQRAVQVMQEAGVDISGQHSKLVQELPAQDFDFVITLCGAAAETCPYFPGNAIRLHRGFDDPPRLAADAKNEEEALGHYRRVRDELRDFIAGLPAILSEERARATSTLRSPAP